MQPGQSSALCSLGPQLLPSMTPELAAQACLQAARFIEGWIAGTADITYTPDGLAWSSQWGSLRYTMNAAFIAEVYSAHIAGEAGSPLPLAPLSMHLPYTCTRLVPARPWVLRHELHGWFRHTSHVRLKH